jgi:pantetheine-phosphate adenylyltransferase
MIYSHVCVAGTFDGLHSGHQALLNAAFVNGEQVTIALTSDQFVAAYKKKNVAPFETRKNDLAQWLTAHEYTERSTIIAIDDPIGPAGIGDFDALIVTSQNKAMGEKINVVRKENGKVPLVLIEVPIVPAQDRKPISSTRIRKGEIDPMGKLVMPDNMREALARPLGRVLTDDVAVVQSLTAHADKTIVTVGDMTTTKLVEQGITPTLAVIDNKINRKDYAGLQSWLGNQPSVHHFISGPGFIDAEVVEAFDVWSNDVAQQVFVIEGEEDLLVLPLVMAAPLGTIIYYGQPNQGMVEVVVDASTQKTANELLEAFN